MVSDGSLSIVLSVMVLKNPLEGFWIDCDYRGVAWLLLCWSEGIKKTSFGEGGNLKLLNHEGHNY